MLRLLAQRGAFDEEARDMTAFVVFNLRSIYQIIDDSAQVWKSADTGSGRRRYVKHGAGVVRLLTAWKN